MNARSMLWVEPRWNVSSGLEYSINCGSNVLVNIKYGPGPGR